ncbi:MAG: NYN domain-containing protein [bacterium]
MDHVCIFIDGSNFYHALKRAGLPTRIDFSKLASALVGRDRKLMQTFYYNTPRVRPSRTDPDYSTREQQYRDQQRFFGALRFVPNLTLKLGRFQKIRRAGDDVTCPSCNHPFKVTDSTTYVEKGVDVMLATDLLVHAMKAHYDVAILISSDADYKYAVERAKLEFGKVVELHQVEGARCYDLISACSDYRPITEAIIQSCLRE